MLLHIVLPFLVCPTAAFRSSLPDALWLSADAQTTQGNVSNAKNVFDEKIVSGSSGSVLLQQLGSDKGNECNEAKSTSFVSTVNGKSNVCTYNKNCVYNPTRAEGELSSSDPRVTIKAHGWKQGIWAKMLMLGRGIINTKMVSLQLRGDDAQFLARAMYGIVTTHVPQKCFPLFKQALSIQFTDNGKTNMGLLKKSKKKLMEVLKKQLPTGCNGNPKEAPENPKEIKRVMNTLWPLWRGYWGLYEPELNEERSILSVRVLDELRVLRNERRVRQIWHYGKVHMGQHTEFSMREQLMKTPSRTERQRLEKQFKSLYMLLEMLDAHLEFVELDNVGSCVSAMKYDPEEMFKLLTSYASSNFLVTLMFRERHWQARGKSVAKFFDHPVLTLKKFGSRWTDAFARAQPPVKIGMLLKPLMKTSLLAGLVLGTVTFGTTTFAVLFAQTMVNIGIEVAVATVPFIEFLVNEALGILTEPIKQYLIMQASTTALGKKQVQYIWTFIDQAPRNLALAEVRSQLDLMVENIITDDKVRREIDRIRNDGSEDAANLALKEGIEDEVRRYVQNTVFAGFAQDASATIQEEFLKLVSEDSEKNPFFGFLPWEAWRRYRSKEVSKKKHFSAPPDKYTERTLRYLGDSPPDSWVGKVVKVDNKLFSLQTRWVTVAIQSGATRVKKVKCESTDGVKKCQEGQEERCCMRVELTEDVKLRMFIYDLEAFRRSQAGWLLWHDWSEYRKSSSALGLKGKDIYFDVNLLPHCPGIISADKCLSTITADTGHRILGAKWKWIGLESESRIVEVKPAGPISDPCSFALKSEVKTCLRVHDPDAFDAFSADAARRNKALAWERGELRASGDVFSDVIGEVRALGGKAKKDIAAEKLVQDRYGHANRMFETDCGSACEQELREKSAADEKAGHPCETDCEKQDIHELKMEMNSGFDMEVGATPP